MVALRVIQRAWRRSVQRRKWSRAVIMAIKAARSAPPRVVARVGPGPLGVDLAPGPNSMGASVLRLRPLDGRAGPVEEAGVRVDMLLAELDGEDVREKARMRNMEYTMSQSEEAEAREKMEEIRRLRMKVAEKDPSTCMYTGSLNSEPLLKL